MRLFTVFSTFLILLSLSKNSELFGQYYIFFKKGSSSIRHNDIDDCNNSENYLEVMEPEKNQVFDKITLTSCTVRFDHNGIRIPSTSQIGGNLYNDNGSALHTYYTIPRTFHWKATPQQGSPVIGATDVSYGGDPERITSITFTAYATQVQYDYDLKLAVVASNRRTPFIVTPDIKDSENIHLTSVTLQAPDFLTKNFRPNELRWYRGQYLTDALSSGHQLNIEYKNSDSLVHCTKQFYSVRVVKAGWEGWESTFIPIKFGPNLKVGTDVIVKQPECTLTQSDGNLLKTYGYIGYGSSVGIREFIFKKNYSENIRATLGQDEFEEIAPDTSAYKITFHEAFGLNLYSCPQTETIRIAHPKPLAVSDTSFLPIPCHGQTAGYTLRVKGNTPKDTVLLDGSHKYVLDNDRLSTILHIAKGAHTLKIKDQNGCVFEKEFSFTATEPPKLVPTLTIQQPLCHTGKATATLLGKGGTGAYQYRFERDSLYSPTKTVARSAGSRLSPSIKDANGCIASLRDTAINLPADFFPSAAVWKHNRCFNDSLAEALVKVTGNGRYSYSKDSLQFQPLPLLKGLSTGSNRLYVRNDSNCTKSVTVNVNSMPKIRIDPLAKQDVTCQGYANGQYQVLVSGGRGKKVLYGDSLPSYSSGSGTFNHTFRGLKARSYTLVAQDDSGCVQKHPFLISTRSSLAQSFKVTKPTCEQSSDGQIAASVSGGVKPYRYRWEGMKRDSSLLQNVGIGMYVLTTTDSLSCTETDTVEVTASIYIPVKIEGYPYVCRGQKIPLDAGLKGLAYHWTRKGEAIATSQKVEADTGGFYRVDVMDKNGCVGTDSMEIYYVDKTIEPSFLMTSKAVVGDTVVVVSNNAGFDKLWWSDSIPNSTSIDSPHGLVKHYVFEKVGEYHVSMRMRQDNCMASVTKKITIYPTSEKQAVEESLGIKSRLVKNVAVFPNPTTGSFTLSIELTYERDATIALVALSNGSRIASRNVYGKSRYAEEFEQELSQGLYMLYINVGSETASYRVLVTSY